MSSDPEVPTSGVPDYANETVRRQIVDECVMQAMLLVDGVKEGQGQYTPDSFRAHLAVAAQDPGVASAITEPSVRATTLATIARDTASPEPGEKAAALAATLEAGSSEVLYSVAAILKDSGVLTHIADQAERASATVRLAEALQDPTILGDDIPADERDRALASIAFTSGDVSILEGQSADEVRQAALLGFAIAHSDLAVARSLAHPEARAHALLSIAIGTQGRVIAEDLLDVVAQVEDAHARAGFYDRYIERTGDVACVAVLQEAAEQIQDVSWRAYYLASVFVITKDMTLVPTLMAETAKARVDEVVLDKIWGSLARGLNDFQYATHIRSPRDRDAACKDIILATNDIEEAWRVGDLDILCELAVQTHDVDLALRIATRHDSPYVSRRSSETVLQIALQQQDIAAIRRIESEPRRREALTRFLVAMDDPDLARSVEDGYGHVRRQALGAIAEKRRDLELAREAGSPDVLKRIGESIMASSYAELLPLDEIMIMPDAAGRALQYRRYFEFMQGTPVIAELAAAAIREAYAPGSRHAYLLVFGGVPGYETYLYEAAADILLMPDGGEKLQKIINVLAHINGVQQSF